MSIVVGKERRRMQRSRIVSRLLHLIERAVDERVGAVIVLPRNMNEDNIGKCSAQATNIIEEWLECRHLHLVLTVHLPHDKLAIEVADETVRVVALGHRETGNERLVFSDIIRFDADPLHRLIEYDPTHGVFEDRGDRCLPRIST